jgi:outer membrane protein OmpA-like peptidoglycan-associated protein
MKTTLTLILLLATLGLTAQQDPFFMPFEGPIVDIPTKHMRDAKFAYSTYKDKIQDYEQIAEASFKELKIPNTLTDVPFPGVNKKDRYGMVLKSEMIIKQKGCYVFDLFSDDGSVFWINKQLIVNNDGTHKYRRRTDTVSIDKGKYPIRIWYYQGFPNKYGLTFDGIYIGKDCPETATILEEPVPEKISISSKILFNHDSYDLISKAKLSLDTIVVQLRESELSEITVIGHSCTDGTPAYNLELSQNRADAIRDYLLRHMRRPGIIYRSIGKGSSVPISPNDTEINKSKNRRVDILVK